MAFSEVFLDDLRATLPMSTVVGKTVDLKKEGREFVGRSPFRNDADPSSFKVNDGKRICHDFATGETWDIFGFVMKSESCDFPEAVKRCAEIAGVSLPADDRAPARTNGVHAPDPDPPFDPDPPPAEATRKEITATYDYTDAQGTLIYQVVRMEWTEGGKRKKTFRQRRPAGDDWVWNLEGIEHGLYRLVELNELKHEGAVVWLPEGEKDVETLRAWEEIATTNSGGAKNWNVRHAQALTGCDVIIPIDNDDAGRARGQAVAISLRGVAKRIRILDFAKLWQGAPKGADVTDWRDQAHGTPKVLLDYVETIPDWKPEFKSQFGGMPFEDLDLPGPEHEFLIDGWMTVGDKSIIGGPSKSGKSFLAIEAAGCIATGKDFFGAKVMAPGLVIYQAGEGTRGVKKRFRAWRQYNAIDPKNPIPIYILQSKIDLYRPDGDTAKLIEEIKGIQTLYDVPLRALFIDTLATATGGADENSGKDMSTVMANVDKLAQAIHGCHVCLVHHFNAAGTKLRGHSSIYANIDQVVLVTREEGSKVKTAVLDKQKDEEDGLQIRFELFQLQLGQRADGKPITSCVTLPVGGAVAARTEGKGGIIIRLTNERAVILQALKDALSEHGVKREAVTMKQIRELPKSITTVVDARRWKEAYMMKAPDAATANDNTINKRIRDASNQFQTLKIIGRINPYCWLTGRATGGVVEIEKDPQPAAVDAAPAQDQAPEPPPNDDQLPID